MARIHWQRHILLLCSCKATLVVWLPGVLGTLLLLLSCYIAGKLCFVKKTGISWRLARAITQLVRNGVRDGRWCHPDHRGRHLRFLSENIILLILIWRILKNCGTRGTQCPFANLQFVFKMLIFTVQLLIISSKLLQLLLMLFKLLLKVVDVLVWLSFLQAHRSNWAMQKLLRWLS